MHIDNEIKLDFKDVLIRPKEIDTFQPLWR